MLTGCNLNIDRVHTHEQTWYDENYISNEKLAYALQGIIDVFNHGPNTKIIPLESDKEKAIFVYNILNNNFEEKYIYTEEFLLYNAESEWTPVEELNLDFEKDSESSLEWQGEVFPILENEEIELINPICSEDWITILWKALPHHIAYKKSDIDKILTDLVWNTIIDAKNITKNWLKLDWDKYLFYNHTYYGFDNILSRWRWTQFTIDEIKNLDGKNVEIKATYVDDYLDWECKITYKWEKNDSFYGYKFNEYSFSWCEPTRESYFTNDFPTRLIYWINEELLSNSNKIYYWEFEQKYIDLDNDWVEEIFGLGRDYPNWVALFWRKWENWYNFKLDFDKKFFDEWDELIDGISAEMYFKDLNWDGNIEVLVALWDKKENLEVNVYRITEDWFEKAWRWKIIWKSYMKFDPDYKLIYVPYADNWFCKVYGMQMVDIYEVRFEL